MCICLVAINVPDPIALYPLNSKYETREVDNRQPQGTPNGVSLVAGPNGKPGGSYQFSGQPNSYIKFSSDGGLNAHYSITMLCWVYLETSDVSGPLFNYESSIGFGGIRLAFDFGKLATSFQETLDQLLTNESLAANQWHYVGSSYDNKNGYANLWLNGTIVAQKYIGDDIILPTGRNVMMGAPANRDDLRCFKGRITAMQVYDVALNAEQINEVKDAGRGRI